MAMRMCRLRDRLCLDLYHHRMLDEASIANVFDLEKAENGRMLLQTHWLAYEI